MNRPTSPIFDVLEFPPLRRVKPLPKRRRTTGPEPDGNRGLVTTVPSNNGHAQAVDVVADELVASFSSSMALQSYYLPTLGDLRETMKAESNAPSPVGPPEGDGQNASDVVSSREEEHSDGDYLEHPRMLTKKRKVPVTNAASQPGEVLFASSTTAEEEPEDTPPSARTPADSTEGESGSTPVPTSASQKRPRQSRAIYATLQLKELVRGRKRQLSNVIGTLSHGDTLALDQALSSNYPWSKISLAENGFSMQPRPLRRSHRRVNRGVHGAVVPPEPGVRSRNASRRVTFPHCSFTIKFPNATSERWKATREEVELLHARFEVELTKQAVKAAEAARQVLERMQKSKRRDRSQQRMRTGSGRAGNDQSSAGLLDQTMNTKTKNKKKKRSAMANASNPHHLRNYVPSRVAHPGGNQSNANAQNLLSPQPLRFLSAELSRRDSRPRRAAGGGLVALTNPEDEWICPFCEYNLFYGSEQSYRKAIRSRKRILNRRRRARIRAAAAANGKRATAPAEKNDDVPDQEEQDSNSVEGGGTEGGAVGPGPNSNNRGVGTKAREKGRGDVYG